jgi:hypothetical protein
MQEAEVYRFENATCVPGKKPGVTIFSGIYGKLILTEKSIMFLKKLNSKDVDIPTQGISSLYDYNNLLDEKGEQLLAELLSGEKNPKEFFEKKS